MIPWGSEWGPIGLIGIALIAIVLVFVLSCFGFNPGPANEGPSASAQGQGQNGVNLSWIPADNINIQLRQHSNIQQHVGKKKKKSRRHGKERPSHASGSVPQLRSTEGGWNSQNDATSRPGRSSTNQTTGHTTARMDHGPQNLETYRASAGNAASAVDDEEEGEDLPYDEWLQELMIQVNEDKAVSVHNEETTPSASGATVPNVASLTNGHDLVLQKLRMVQRKCRYAFLLADTYDESFEETSVEELRRKADQTPDKYKICTFRQYMTGRAYAVPQDRKSADEIPIISKKRRGHALNSDKVLVEVLENEDEQEVEEGHDAKREIKISGKVVGIIEHNANPQIHKFVCFLDPQIDNVMVPINRSFPKMIILGGGTSKNNTAVVTLFEKKKKKAQTLPEHSPRRKVEVKYAERHRKLFVVCYREWPPKTPYPLGIAVEELDHGDTEEKGLNILRIVHGIKDQCESAEIKEMHRNFLKGWSIPDEAVQKREDFRTTKTIFTVDPPESTDLDDAISCVCLPGQLYEVGVHIADVSYFIQKDSAIDKAAYKRGTTFYHPFQGDADHMLPKDVILRLLSLLPGEDRLALSVIFTLDQEGQIVDQPIVYRSVIKSCKRLTYADVEKLIVDSNSTSNAHMCVAEPIRCLDKLSRHRRLQRLGYIHMVYNTDDDDEGALSYPHAHVMIEELMLMTNNAVAKQVLSRFPDCTPLRRQLAPSQEKVETWKRCHDKTLRNSIRLPGLANPNHNDAVHGGQEAGQDGEDVLVAAKVWQKIRECCESKNASRSHMEDMANLILQDENHPQHALAQSDLYAIMESAEYVVSTSETTPEKQEHYSLQMRAYTQFTSPIRRYIDLVVHRMLVACMENSKCPYTAEEMVEITHHYNNQHAKSKRFGKSTKELKLALKLEEAPIQVTTFVEGITESSMKLLFPYRGYIKSRQRDLPFSLLKPSKKPEVNVGSTDVKVTWEFHMYDCNKECQADSPAVVLHPDVHFRIPEDKWQQILQSIKIMDRDRNSKEFRTAVKTALINAKRSDNPFSQRSGNQDGRPEQRKMGVMRFQRSYQLGDLCRVQLRAQMIEGVLTPNVQLINMTPHLDICAEHRKQPTECFSRTATDILGRKTDIEEYKIKWCQILSMISSHSAVSNDDTVILQNVTITLQRTSNKVTGGLFHLNENFLQEYKIPICKTRNGKTEIHWDYLCIRITQEREQREHHVDPFNAMDLEKQTYVLHCTPSKEVTSSNNLKTPAVQFEVNQRSVPLPPWDNDCHESTVEFISKPEPNRRLEEAVADVDSEGVPVLIQDIVLLRPNHHDCHSDDTLAEILCSVPDSTLHPLNPSQQAAVKKALQKTFSVIQGPPGTGKTVTGAYLAYFFTRLNQLRAGAIRPQVLYCGPSNDSVDVAAAYLKNFKTISIVRVYSKRIEQEEYPIPGEKRSRKEASMPDGLSDIALHRLIGMSGKPHAKQLAAYEEQELKNHDIVLCTCSAAGTTRISRLTSFIQVIIDEAGMCSEPETLIPLVSVKPKQVVLIGDHQQLRPIITEPIAKQLGMDISLLEKYKKKAEMLTTQYRMHHRICKFPSSAFYNGKLRTAESVMRRGPDPIYSIWPNNGETPTVFCHVDGREDRLSVKSEEGNEGSKSNGAEIGYVIRIVRGMISKGVSPEKIIVLSQYNHQCTDIVKRLKKNSLRKIKVSTVVKSQGSEADYVVFSTVRSKPRSEIDENPSKGWQKRHLGLINDENQMNVALTRAKRGLIIVGNKYLLRCQDKWRKMLTMYKRDNCLLEVRDFLASLEINKNVTTS